MRIGKRVRASALLSAAPFGVLGGLAGLPLPVHAGTMLLCERPEVLRIFDRTVREWNTYNRIVEDSVREAPTTAANAVTCDVRVSTVGYEPSSAGWVPRRVYEVRRFAVQVIGHRVLVRVAE